MLCWFNSVEVLKKLLEADALRFQAIATNSPLWHINTSIRFFSKFSQCFFGRWCNLKLLILPWVAIDSKVQTPTENQWNSSLWTPSKKRLQSLQQNRTIKSNYQIELPKSNCNLSKSNWSDPKKLIGSPEIGSINEWAVSISGGYYQISSETKSSRSLIIKVWFKSRNWIKCFEALEDLQRSFSLHSLAPSQVLFDYIKW